jgi:hypothetical protein
MMKKIFVFAAAVVFMLGMSTPSWAVADFAIGGSVRLDVGFLSQDFGDWPEAIFGAGAEDSRTDFYVSDPGNNRLNFKATVGDVTGFFEFGFGAGSTSMRHAYASWDMGGGSSLLFGHTWSIMSFGFTDQRQNGDLANIGFGCLYWGRNPQLRYTYAGETFTVQVSIEENRITFPSGLTGALYLQEDVLPMISATGTFAPMETLTLTPSVMYQTYDWTGGLPGVRDVSVDVWCLAVDGRLDFDMFRISFEGWYGQNLGGAANLLDLRPAFTVPFGAPVGNATGTDIEDVNTYGGFVQLTFRFEPALLNIGGGYQQADVENSPSALYESDISTMSFFVNVLYNLTDNFYVQPEISYFDYGDDALKGANDLGSDVFVGVHFQADF